MKLPPRLLLSAFLPVSAAFGQMVITGPTGVTTWFYGSIVGQDLFITVENTHAGDLGETGTLTAFGFNTPWTAPLDTSKIILSYSVLTATGPTDPWYVFTSKELNANGLQLTTDLAVASDGNPSINGNDPLNGVAFGESVAFKFTFDAAYSLAPFAGLDDLGYPKFPLFFNQTEGPDFFARWQEVANSTVGDSDAAARDWPPEGYDIPQGPVPEPSTYGAVAAAALVALITLRRMRR